MLTYDLDTLYTGTSPSSATQPWLRATLTELGGADLGKIEFKLEAVNLTDPESVKNWWFNYSGTASDLMLDSGSMTAGSFALPTLGDAANSAAGTDFDFSFDFATGNPADRFTQGDVFTGIISGTSPLDLAMFNIVEIPNTITDGLVSAAHVQSIGVNGDSGHIGSTGDNGNPPPPPPEIPEVSQVAGAAVLGAGVLLTYIRGRRKEQVA